MAQKSKPNTFLKGMMTDLDPSYQSKESYFTGLNVRVVTNGDSSYSLENIKGSALSYEFNKDSDSSYLSGNNEYKIHGAVVVQDYIVSIESNSETSKNWRIRKYPINPQTLAINSNYNSNPILWTGASLFSDNAGEIKIESIVETDLIHRIYCTDGLTVLKSANIVSDISSYTITDFSVFKPSVKNNVVLTQYNQSGGNLTYGSYSYTYRLSSAGGSNYTDWSPISKPINIVKNDLTSNTSLGVEGESSSETSSASLSLSISGLSLDYESIEIAAIHYVNQNVPVISKIEEGNIISSTYIFQHSGFETTTPIEGGIAAAIINTNSWNVCKSLAQKDNKLYASNLKSETLNIDTNLSGLFPLKSYKGVLTNGTWDLETYSTDANPDRHNNGGTNNWSWDVAEDTANGDKSVYKFINKNFNTSANPLFVLGAETPAFSSGGYGFRMTFTQEDYIIDEDFHRSPDGTASQSNEQDATELYFLSSSHNDSNYLNGKKGPHNPKWNNEFTSFKRGECYRFGIVFYDLQGTPGFTHHLGDIKMPDALDPNVKILNANGDAAVSKSYNSINDCWSPFSSTGSGTEQVIAHALIPRLEVNLPTAVQNKISGYKIVRAELSENDKTIITQGILSTTELHHSTESSNTTLAGKTGSQTVPYYVHKEEGNTSLTAYPLRIAEKQYTIETPEITLGGKFYSLNSGYKIKPLYIVEQNKIHNESLSTYKFTGYDVKTNPDSGNIYGGLRVHKYKPHPMFLLSATSNSAKNNLKTPNYEYLVRWTRDVYYGKSVVSGEEISGTSSNLARTYRHETAQYDNNNPNQFLSTNAGIGGIQPYWFDHEGRGAWLGGTSSNLYVSTTANAPLLGDIINYTNNAAGVNESFSDIPSNYRSYGYTNDDGAIHFLPYKWIVEVIRDTTGGNFEQYGGHTDAAIKNTRFIDCSSFQSSATDSVLITQGDTYCDWYTYKNSFDPSDGPDSLNFGSCVPLESSINIGLRSGTYLGSSEKAVCNFEDNYLYNKSYSQQNNLIGSVVKPTYWNSLDVFRNKIAASATKIYGEIKDSWSRFPINDFIELNLAQGMITDLINFKNKLFAIQESGVSILSVNSRALIQAEGAAADIQIVTGTGTAIERFDYLSTEFGSQHYNKSIITPTGFYFLDKINSEIIKSNGQSVNALGLTNGYKNFIENITVGKNIINSVSNNLGSLSSGLYTGYDPEFRECHFSIKDSIETKSNFTLSDLTGSLTSKLDIVYGSTSLFIKKYIEYNNSLFCVVDEADNNADSIHLLNSGFYQNFNFGFIVNDNPTVNKVFDTSEIVVKQNIPTGITTSQNFTSHTLSDSTLSNATSGSNERIRENMHRVVLRGDNTNRARGTWLKHTIEYSQPLSDGNITSYGNRKFDIFAITTKYRESR